MFSSNTSAVSADAVFVEDVMSTTLYTGNNSTQTITNGIDLSTKGGMVWVKDRDATWSHEIFDTARGAPYGLYTNSTSAQVTENDFGSFLTNGFSFDGAGINNGINVNGDRYASWTFRKQPKFFDVVTWTGNGTNPRQIAHNLGSVPGCIIVKSTTRAENWTVYHRSLGNAARMALNTTDAQVTGTGVWGSTTPTSTYFTVSADNLVNFNGDEYVAYLFAHDAGGFGLTGTDNVISCGSFNGAANTTVTLGYEPQWIMFKNTTNASNWQIIDNMRGMPVGSDDRQLMANLSNDESDNGLTSITATGFTWLPSAASNTYIYIAIRRGPMKTPTTGTSVFSPVLRNGTGANANIQSGFPTDLIVFLNTDRSWDAMGNYWTDRLRSGLKYITSTATSAESDWNNAFQNNNGFDTQNGVLVTSDVANGVINHSGTPYINWMFRRAPGFFDVVCYTGTGSARTVTHNLGVAPELLIVKRRDGGTNSWLVYDSFNGATKRLVLNFDYASAATSDPWNDTAPTSSVFTVGISTSTNGSGSTYVAYLFATVSGVSKVGSYTGTGTTKQIDCGFTGGARFVLIKRTDSTGDWYVWDSARGIVSGNDPYLLLNSTAAEVTNTDYVDTYSAGFEISSTAPAAINANGGSFIFLAIA